MVAWSSIFGVVGVLQEGYDVSCRRRISGVSFSSRGTIEIKLYHDHGHFTAVCISQVANFDTRSPLIPRKPNLIYQCRMNDNYGL